MDQVLEQPPIPILQLRTTAEIPCPRMHLSLPAYKRRTQSFHFCSLIKLAAPAGPSNGSVNMTTNLTSRTLPILPILSYHSKPLNHLTTLQTKPQTTPTHPPPQSPHLSPLSPPTKTIIPTASSHSSSQLTSQPIVPSPIQDTTIK